MLHIGPFVYATHFQVFQVFACGLSTLKYSELRQ